MKIDRGLVKSWSDQPGNTDGNGVDDWAAAFAERSLGDSYTYSLVRTGSSANGTSVEGSDYDYKVAIEVRGEERLPGVNRQLLASCKKSLFLSAQKENGTRWASRTNKCVQLEGIIDGQSVDILPALRIENGGLLFWTDIGEMIIDYPMEHIKATAQKDFNTEGRLRPTIRALKLARRAMDIPMSSYQIERFLLAAPVDLYQGADTLTRLRKISQYFTSSDQRDLYRRVIGKEATVLSLDSYKDSMNFWGKLSS